MSERIPDSPADTLQRLASDPARSAWVSANAGSGKTEVLVQRVMRLMLDGARPDEILCLTYTKAAAAVMTNRVFERLAGWIGMDPPALTASVRKLTGEAPDAATLREARRLFAAALETPGGLKIQTIHAFCERLLHLFPFGADAPAHFEVLDEAAQNELIADAVADIVAGRGEGGAATAEAYALVAEHVGEDDARALLTKMIAARSAVASDDTRAADLARLASAAGIAVDDTDASLAQAYVAHPFWTGDCSKVIAALRDFPLKTNLDAAASLTAALHETDPLRRCAHLRDVFLSSKGELLKPASYMTKKARDAHGAAADMLDAEAARFLALCDRFEAREAVARNRALFLVADATLASYRAAKARRGALDFSDLIDKTRALLTDPSVGPWALYKLDSRLTHILVDEAQDTSDAQWDIIRKLAEEFTAGDGARTQRRTMFAVGDEKQSIYGFQGAAPRAFAENRAHFKRLHDDAGLDFRIVPFTVSFRSTQETLSAVDRIFKGDGAQGLSFGDAADVAHESTRREADDIGFVELWPLIGKLEGPAIDDALAPAADGEAPEAEPDPPNARLAARVARHVRLLIENGDPCGRSVTPGDVMILVRRRGPLFEALIAALKAAGVAVAGADRLRVADHIAVRDCLALARAALAPDDDYALACLLKSPLVGLDDSHLMAFAPERPGRLLDALATAAPSDPALAEAKTKLGRWRARAGDGPFAFFGRILEAEGGRLALTVRLGAEAGDALDEFLARALDFERTESGSLSTFVAAFEESAIAVKRDLDQAANEVRVMTVHAAKGLEAPIVILPDTTAKPEGKEAPPVLRAALPGGGALAVWSTAGARPAPIAAAQAQAAADAADENRRLLYVALTRARNGLIIAGAHGRAPPPGCWFLQITEALDEGDVATGGTLVPFAARDGEGVSRFWTLPGRPLRAPGRSAGAPSTPAPPPPPPDWATAPAPPETPQEPPLSPSRAAEAADRRDRPFDRPGAADARARGRLVHRLLESLPTLAPAARPVAARALAERAGVHLPAEARADLATRALALVENPALALLFGPDSRAEVAVAGRVTLPGGRAVAVGGAIDRLAATATDVLIGDYKTSARPPRAGAPIPARILAQLALYRALVQPLYPGRRVRCLVIWTAGPTVQEAPTEALDAALAGL